MLQNLNETDFFHVIQSLLILTMPGCQVNHAFIQDIVLFFQMAEQHLNTVGWTCFTSTHGLFSPCNS